MNFLLNRVNHRDQFCEHLKERTRFTYKTMKYNGCIQTSHPNKNLVDFVALQPMSRFGMEVYSEDELRSMLAREISKRPWPTVGTVVSIAHDAWMGSQSTSKHPKLPGFKEGHPKFSCRTWMDIWDPNLAACFPRFKGLKRAA